MIPNTDRLNLRCRNGVWHLRKQHNRKRFELSLGTEDRPIAEERARRILASMLKEHVDATWAESVKSGLTPNKGWVWKLWAGAKKRLKGRGSDRLSLEEMQALALRSGGRCMVSGIAFHLGGKLHPFQPSLDRIVAGQSYSASNCRLVCLSVNYCMHRWGEETFLTLTLAVGAQYMENLAREAAMRGAFAGQPISTISGP